MNQKKYRVAVVMSHPINYKIDLYKELNHHPNVDVMVYFGSDFGLRKAIDKTADITVQWYEQEILEDLPHKFLTNYSLNNNSPLDDPLRGIINPSIVSELRHNRYDAVIIDGYMMLTHWFAFFGAWWSKTPIFFKGDVDIITPRTQLRQKIKKIILSPLFKTIDVFLAYNTTNVEFYKYYGASKEKLFFAPYAVNNSYLQEKHQELMTQKTRLKEELFMKSDDVVILFLSKLIKRKRPMDLLKAFEIIDKRTTKRIQLLFVGDGPEKTTLQTYVQKQKLENVHFVGYKKQEELPQYYTIADIFAFPSATEVWGLVVNEAMNFALPIITTDTVGAGRECVKNGENGLIYKTGNVNELSDCITKLVEDELLRKRMGKNSLAIISQWNYAKATTGIVEAITFIKKMGVIVAQPGSHHIWHAAIALEKAKLLKYYVTTIHYNQNKFPYTLLKLLPTKPREKLIANLKRRFYKELNPLIVKTYGFYEWLYIVNNRFFHSQIIYRLIIKRRNQSFARKVGKLATRETTMVWSGMDAALETFKIVKPTGIKCILDQFIGHPIALNKILEEEIRYQPHLKKVVKGFFSETQIKRICQEIELADYVVGSNFVKQTLIDNNVSHTKIVVIPYGVDTNLFKPAEKNDYNDELKLLFVGHISIRKGCHYLLEVMKQLQENGMKLKLVMIGTMEDKFFKEKYGEYFEWIPWVNRNELPTYFQAADIYVYPSLFEGSALSIYEALASGLPVITTLNSGSVVEDNKDGFIVQIRDVAAIKEKVRLLYDNPQTLHTMSLAARKKAEQYTWNKYQENVINFIKKLNPG